MGQTEMTQREFDDEEMVSLGDMLGALQNESMAAKEAAHDLYKRKMKDPPHAVSLERALLASLFIHGGNGLNELEDVGLKPSDFYREANQSIFSAMRKCLMTGNGISSALVIDELHRMRKLDDVGGTIEIQQLEVEGLELAKLGGDTFRAHAESVLEKSRSRQAIELCRKATVDLYMGDGTSSSVIDGLQTALEKVDQGTSFQSADLRAAVKEAMDALPSMGGQGKGIPTAFLDLDAKLRGGPSPGQLIIVAGRPAMGKTQFVLDIAVDMTVRRKMPVLFVSLEMGGPELVTRMAAARSGVSTGKPQLGRSESTKLSQAFGEIAEAPFLVHDSSTITIGQLRSIARAAHRKSGISALFVDYLQLMSGDSKRSNDNRTNEVAEISRGLKQLARELQIPVIALSQLSRGVESRTDKRPVMSDLRESGSIEQDADVVMFLYREEYYLREATPVDKTGLAEVIIAKNRQGATGAVALAFESNIPRFRNRVVYP